jgi:UDP-glucuronate 4-epimerase|tara:strand:- start:3726 stop:4661 length:936 start_codon:yes stop_codon:yes gene_type:complete
MKIMITGIAGFIGMHTAIRMKELGHDVTGFDNCNSYYDPKLKEVRIQKLRENGVDFKYADLRDEVQMMRIIEEKRPDLVIHLAAMAGVRYSMNNADEYIDTNCKGTLNLIRAMERWKTQNVIYASTSCVMHGNPLPWGEPEYLFQQINPYGYTKAITESQFHISKIPNAVGLRFFTVYGPWGRPDMALFDFTKNILAGNPITLFNNGDMQRDFTYVDDIVQGIECVTDNMTPRDMYSIGRGEVVELQRFVDAIQDTLGKKAIIEYGPMHPADAKATASDTTKLKKLGYAPKTSIEEGVQNFVDWYKEYHSV